jgi:hypothetical protein
VLSIQLSNKHKRIFSVQFKIESDLRETGWEDVEWTHLTQDEEKQCNLVESLMNFFEFHKRKGIS